MSDLCADRKSVMIFIILWKIIQLKSKIIVISVRIFEKYSFFFSECVKVKVNGTVINGRVPRLLVPRLNREIMITTSPRTISKIILPRPGDGFEETESMIFQRTTEYPHLVVHYAVKSSVYDVSQGGYVEKCLVCREMSACELSEMVVRWVILLSLIHD